MSDVRFKEEEIRTFMGGDFDIGHPKTVSAMRMVLKDIEVELAKWGDDTEIAEVWMKGAHIQITLKHGIPQ